MELLEDITAEQHQIFQIVGFYGLDSVEARDSYKLRFSVRQLLENLYQLGYRNFAVVSETGFSLLVFRELVHFQMTYIDIRIMLFEIVGLDMDEWKQAEKIEYIELRQSASFIIHTLSDKEKGRKRLPKLARKLSEYCQHLVCYVRNNSEHLEYIKKIINVTTVQS